MLNTRPSTLARWGLDYKSLHARHPKLVVLHVSGYGLGGPASDRPGFGTLAEAMSGFAHVCGQADGPPTLPPFMLADGVAAQSATYAVMTALYHRDVHGAGGQLVDVSLIEPLARLIEQATLAYDQLGRIQGRSGNRADASAPRNAYRTADDRWIAISSASSSVAARLYRAIDRPDLAARPEYVDPIPRQARADEIDALVTEWIRAHTLDQAMKVFLSEDVAAAPIYDAQQLLADEHLRARGTFVAVDDPDLGAMTVQAPVARLSVTPGRIEHLGRALGADNETVYGDLLGLDDVPYPGYRDEAGYRAAAMHASLLGYDGKWAIHPCQVPIANEVFTPAADEVAEARAIIADYRRAEADGQGAIGRDGKLVDAAMMRHAENVLRRAAPNS